MHRDLKPENLMLKNKRILYDLNIVDFGLSSFEGEDRHLFSKCGTPGYIAPEILNCRKKHGDRYTTKVDIFSAGVIFHLM